jgi:ADP-ribosylglycohydrolase
LKGLLFGGALGDALGVPHEFRYCKAEYNGKLEHILQRTNRYNGDVSTTEIGQVSDDTEMSICILNSLIENDMVYQQEKVALKYMDWSNSGTKMMGINTRDLFKGVTTYSGYRNRYNKKFEKTDVALNAQSNGAIMRCGILVIFKFQDDKLFRRIVKEDCYLTNPNKFCYRVNYIFLTSVYQAMIGKTKKEILKNAIDNANFDEIYHILQCVKKKKIVDVNNNKKGWCIYGIYLAYYSLIHFDNYADGIDYIIQQKGDTDTNACIAGYLLGAFYGYDKMVSHKRTKKNIHIMMKCDTSQSSHPRPSIYHLKNYLTDENVDLLIKFIA